MYLYLLSVYGSLYNYSQSYKRLLFSKIRHYIGPEPSNYYIMPCSRIVSASMNISEQDKSTAILFNTENKTLLSLQKYCDKPQRPKYISILISHPSFADDIDISDWIGDIRANHDISLSLKQFVELWSFDNNQYIPFDNNLTLFTIDKTGLTQTEKIV